MKTNILHHSPHNGQTTHLGGEGINLISALSDVAEKALDGIGRLDVMSHCRWEVVKSQEMLFILNQATHRFRIALTIFCLKRMQIGECILLLLLFPNPREIRLDGFPLSSWDRVEDIVMLMDQAALTRGCEKQLRDGGQQSVMSIGDDEIHLRGSSPSHIVQQTQPPFFALLCTGTQRQDLF